MNTGGSNHPIVDLLDVLPGDAAHRDAPSTPSLHPLSPSLTDALMRDAVAGGSPLALLCAALALAELRLTGAAAVGVAQRRDGRTRRGEVVGADMLLARGWASCVDGVLVVGTPDAAVDGAWIAVDVGDSESSGASSIWSFDDDTHAQLRIRHDERWSVAAVEAMADAVQRVLTQLLRAAPDTRLDAIVLLDVDERALQLQAWNPPGMRRQGSVVERFAAVSAATSTAIAIVEGDATLDYAGLALRARAFAARLRAAGVTAGDAVGLALPRSTDAIVAMLGILDAGAAYLPLDLSLPRERLTYMLDDARVAVIVADAHIDAHIDAAVLRSARVIAMTDAIVDADTTDARMRDSAAADGDALAYVMYTSGSTGTPKGVEIRHRSILRLVCDVDYLLLDRDVRLLHAAPLGFDASTLEVWGALLNGGRVVIHDEAVPTGAGLAAVIATHGVTTAWLTAALFNAIVDEDAGQLAGLRELITGGEALSVDHVRRLQRAAPRLRLHNGYGPTECTTFTCTYAIPTDLPAHATSVPIGRPIAETTLYVLNGRGDPLPLGVAGELYVGGAGLARGYLGRADLTDERFVPDPFGADGDRLYRTGDRVRYRADGVVEFVGRVDDQVKIRGFRIEPGEIESVLATHPAVRSCAVLARADGGTEKRLVAYVVPSGAVTATPPQLRAFLAASLPEFMLPVRYVSLDALPVTANGKLDRRALPAPDRGRPELAAAYAPGIDDGERTLCVLFADLLDIERVGRHDNFFELGGSSLLAVHLADRIRRQRGAASPFAATLVFAHPTPAALAAALTPASVTALDPSRLARGRGDAARDPHEPIADDPIAIVAMAGRFPGAADVEAFWQNLCDGRDTIRHFSDHELDPSVPIETRRDPDYVAARGVIDAVDRFDAAFFGIGPREAELMDPQQRVFLELCWECLERGGHAPGAPAPATAAGTAVTGAAAAGAAVTGAAVTGVFAGMYNATYFQRHVAAHPQLVDSIGAFQVMLGNEKDYIATRVAHKLGLTGPAISVHTACSTSLVAICQAVDSLRAGRCDMALAGGVAVTCPPDSGYRYQEGGMLSPDGRTRSFDVDARGTVFSDGAAVVLLKRLSDAVADGDQVIALIRGGAINNDGADKASFTAPSSAGQAAVIAMAHDDAGVDARSIGYVEAHGTATPLGDPIEIDGLTQAFRRSTDAVGFCRVGSLKSNVGHLVIAAGAAGVIKTALALREQRIPASLHFTAPNPAIAFAGSPFVVNGTMTAWPRVDAQPRRAGVSAFGVGGTNAHVVMEEAPTLPDSDDAHGAQLLVLSARTPAALAQAVARLGDHLEATVDANLADAAWTLDVGRRAFAHRVALVADDAADAVAQLRGGDIATAVARSAPARSSGVVFLFPGQGAQYAGMGRALHAEQPAFRDAFDACADGLRDELGFDLRERVFGDDADALLPTALMQPAIFAIEYALATLWMSLGVRPVAMVGHSVGEFVAATLAGVFSLPDALCLVARRGRLMQAQPGGAMLSVRASFDDMSSRLPDTLSMAAENAPGSVVVAGPDADIDAFADGLAADGIASRRLHTSHAFHSSMMDAVVAPFRDAVEGVARHAPTLPIVSTVTGTWLDAASATSADYWARHLREPVRFALALARVVEDASPSLLEVGPRTTLATLARQHPLLQARQIATVSSLLDSADNECVALRRAAGQLWCSGAAIAPSVFDHRSRRRRVVLPTYPFERQRYWVDAAPAALARIAPTMSLVPAAQTATSAIFDTPLPPLAQVTVMDRKPRLIAELKGLFEDVAGYDLADADTAANFIELGLDSLMLTQVALQLQKTFAARITFRQLMGECASLDRLAEWLDRELPPEAAPIAVAAPAAQQDIAVRSADAAGVPMVPTVASPTAAGGDYVRQVIDRQMQLMAQHLALLSGAAQAAPVAVPPVVPPAPTAAVASNVPPAIASPMPGVDDEEAALAHTRYDVKKAFGAIARIDNAGGLALDAQQRRRLDAFIERYVARTRKSKDYTQAHRGHMADPRVVNGFKPLLKEMIYQIVIERSKGAHLWDIDGNEYVDALNGFGMSLFGWQPDFVLDAIRAQLELGYEIGPQHPLAGEVAKLMCEVTGHDRAALCNTGSEAVLGALRIARTVTGRETVVLFTGAYHGIVDEMIVRGTKKLRAVPAAPGILRNTAEHVLVLDYGTPESLQIIRERAHEIAAVLVEPVQSRRPDFRPREFLHELRAITSEAGALLVFDEVVTGFRAHPGGAQAVFDIRADLATYGKVVGGGYPIGVIAGRRECMDALDGGHWQYGDDSVPTVGVTYFAGTFVRHPLALAAAKAVLEHIQAEGPELQARLNARVEAMADELNAFCNDAGAPIAVKQFASVWKTQFLEDHPLQDLLFAMMRSRGIHILDNFPCFFTTAHGEADFRKITDAFKASVTELQDAEFLPRRTATPRTVMDAAHPPLEGARIGRDPDGRPAWFVPDPQREGKFCRMSG